MWGDKYIQCKLFQLAYSNLMNLNLTIEFKYRVVDIVTADWNNLFAIGTHYQAGSGDIYDAAICFTETTKNKNRNTIILQTIGYTLDIIQDWHTYHVIIDSSSKTMKYYIDYNLIGILNREKSLNSFYFNGSGSTYQSTGQFRYLKIYEGADIHNSNKIYEVDDYIYGIRENEGDR